MWIPTLLGIPLRSWVAGTVTKIVDMPLVTLGATVREGGPVGTMSGRAEFMLIDTRRTDGERTGSATGSPVSPFDYLRDDLKAALIARHVAEVVQPYFRSGAEVGNSRPWEPLLTNRMLFHANHRGTLVGEWMLKNRSWSAPDRERRSPWNGGWGAIPSLSLLRPPYTSNEHQSICATMPKHVDWYTNPTVLVPVLRHHLVDRRFEILD